MLKKDSKKIKKLDKIRLNYFLSQKDDRIPLKKTQNKKISSNLTQVQNINKKLKKKTLENYFFESYKNNKIFKNLSIYSIPKNFKIKKAIRLKLINWLIKLFLQNNNFEIIFKSIQIIDLFFLKKKNIIFDKKNLQIITLTSFYIASKYYNSKTENLENFLKKFNLKIFSIFEIKKKESKILSHLNFRISYSTYYDLLNFYIGKFFEISKESKKIYFIGKIFLFFLISDFHVFFKNPKLVVFSCIINSFRYFFSELIFKEENYFNKKEIFCNEKKIVREFINFFNLDFMILKNEIKFVKDSLKNLKIKKYFFDKIQFKIKLIYLM